MLYINPIFYMYLTHIAVHILCIT